jgi:hypothetical protein
MKPGTDADDLGKAIAVMPDAKETVGTLGTIEAAEQQAAHRVQAAASALAVLPPSSGNAGASAARW